jgi:lipopolysaccharide/colanic/teichoic acid biosynthesis glycosyltransferase
MKQTTAPTAAEISVQEITRLDLMDVVFGAEQPGAVLPLQQKFNLGVKRFFDLVVSSILLLLLFSWVLPVIALLIRLDSKGPVFFLQQRHKKGGKKFTCFKFRTMIVNDDADLLPAYREDHRITPFGRFLRDHYLDELPQLLNVWWGDMSLIGPRPYMIRENEKYALTIEDYHFRHSVKPGMTGLAQASGHFGFLANSAEMRQRLSLDEAYIRNWSLGMDVKIIVRTIRLFLGRK